MAEATITAPHQDETASGLAKRASVVLSLVVITLLVLWMMPPLFFNLGVVVMTMLVLREFYLLQHANAQGWRFRAAGIGGGALLTLQMTFFPEFQFGITLTVVALLLLSFLVLRKVTPSTEEFQEVTLAMFGIVYVGGMFGQLVLIRNADRGRELATLLIVTVLAREIGAVLGGRVLASSRPMNPHINLKKSYAGAGIGIAAAMGTAIGLSRRLHINLTPTAASGFGFCLGVACQFGDLAESYLKRITGRRHSSNLLGPEGGLLDFLDAIAFAVVVARLFVYFRSY